ncbi:PH domain-containing protein [Streptomyces sp. NPDC048448]|uniref:PH domain-containing protein n=1 Tax=Streptomyces TaxID=1883 RepID=UPI00143EE622|nr:MULTISPECIES: PH domain-containing protein [unclassified Streptomyces]QIY64293.1 PH domain-containing protein [Streptomyces sp. RPA4-2]
MTTPDHQPPPPDAPRPESRDRIYRSPAGLAGGVLLLAIIGWLGIDALVSAHGRTPWLTLAAMILLVPLVSAFTLRPAVYANEDRLRVRNPFRVIVLPWGAIASLRSGYSNEVVTTDGTKYQLWAIPVSLRSRKRVARRQARGADRRGRLAPAAPARAQADQAMDDLRELAEAHPATEGVQGAVSVRWAYEVMGPALAGAVVLAILLAVG